MSSEILVLDEPIPKVILG